VVISAKNSTKDGKLNMAKNVIIILSDQHKWDAWGRYNTDIKTPNLDRLAAEGTVFENCYCATQPCVPSRASFMTGLYPEVHGVISNFDTSAPNQTTWAGHLSENEVQTVAVGRTHHIDKGFDNHVRVPTGDSYRINCHDAKMQVHWAKDAILEASPARYDEYYETRITRTALGFLDDMQRSEEPFLLYMGFLAPHAAMTPPEPFWSMYDSIDVPKPDYSESEYPLKKRFGYEAMQEVTMEQHNRICQGYYGEISTIDSCIGEVLDALDNKGMAEDTVVIYTSDHGEQLGEQGIYSKGYCYESSAKVPMIVRCPGTVEAGRGSQELVNHLDLSPTLCDVFELDPFKSSGKSLWESLCGGKNVERDYLYHSLSNCQVIRNDRYKWAHTFMEEGQVYDEVYDLLKDPDERNNLANTAEGKSVMNELAYCYMELAKYHFSTNVKDLHGDSAKQPRLLPFATT
jgi:arylsulfatase A-like enzyme